MKNKKKKRVYKTTILFIILDLLAIAGFTLMYGPFDKFRNSFVSTAMNTMSHQYLAKIFYSDSTIEKIKNSNYYVEIDEEINLDDVTINTKEKNKYKDSYEEELFTRTPGNDLYKIIDLKVGMSKGYLVAIYDPSKVRLISTKKFNIGSSGERVLTMCERYKGKVCINAGGFVDHGYGSDIPIGTVIKDGEVIWGSDTRDTTRDNIIGMTKEGKLTLLANATANEAIKAGVNDGLVFGPFLIVNGTPLQIVGDPFGKAPRVAIGQTKDGILLFLVIDGENYINGATLQDVLNILIKYGAYNAANLDGGQSSTLIVENKLYNNPPSAAKAQGGRYVVTGFGLIP